LALLQSCWLSSGSDFSDLLPWDSSLRLSTDPAGRPLPRALPHASVPKHPASESRSILVVSHHPDGFLRPEVAGLLHPAASHEVRRVSCFRASGPTCTRQAGPECRGIPHDAIHTPRRIPPYRSRSTSLWPLPPCRCFPSSRPLLPVPLPVPGLEALPSGHSTSRLSSAVGSVTPPPPLPVARRPILPWALFPFEVLLRIVGSRPSIRPSCRRALPKKHPTPDELRSITSPPESGVGAWHRARFYSRRLDGSRCLGSDPSAGSIPAESVRSRSS